MSLPPGNTRHHGYSPSNLDHASVITSTVEHASVHNEIASYSTQVRHIHACTNETHIIPLAAQKQDGMRRLEETSSIFTFFKQSETRSTCPLDEVAELKTYTHTALGSYAPSIFTNQISLTEK